MNAIDNGLLEAFEENYRGARMYHYRAKQFLDEGQHYSVVFNVASVALENYLIALCWLYGVDPGNHNYTCLMDTVEEFMDIPPALDSGIRSLDAIFGICSLEDYHHGNPEKSDMNKVLAMCDGVQKLFDPARMLAVKAALANKEET